jgi:glutathione reductase (NADPH)
MPRIDGIEHAISSNEVFHLEKLPGRIMIAGGGYIANEFAGIFHKFGTQVTLVNRTDVLLRHYDQQLVDRLIQISLRKGIDFKFNATIDKIEVGGDGKLHVSMTGCDDMEVDQLLFATGRQPNTEGLGLEQVGVELGEHGKVKVDDDNCTSVPSIFAVGDVTDRVQLTPVAIREGHAFADTVFGKKPWMVDHADCPSAVFTQPPVGTVGLTEERARDKYGEVDIYRESFRPMKHTMTGRAERTMMKLVIDRKSQALVGAHMVGLDAPEIIQTLAIAVKLKATKQQIDQTIAIHPTAAEEFVTMRTPVAAE